MIEMKNNLTATGNRLLLMLGQILVIWGLTITSAQAVTALEAVQTNTDKLTERVLQLKDIHKQDKDRFYAEVDATLSPLIDFDGFSRGVMASTYRLASEAQRQRFSKQFKEGLIRTYAEALVEFDNQEIEVLSETLNKKDENKSKVKLAFHGKDGSVYPIEYSMVKVNDVWLLRNVVINGINVGLQFKSQFTTYMQKYKDDIDQVIDNWDTRVPVTENK